MAGAHATIPHSVRGRMRVKLSGGSAGEREDALASAGARLRGHGGVRHVEMNHQTGSALITYDPDELDPQSVVGLLREAHEAYQDLAPPRVREVIDRPVSEVAAGVEVRVREANRAVLRATGGSLDLRMLVPIGFAGLAVRQVVTKGLGLESIPWYVLAYYSLDSFLKLHARDGRAGSV